MTEAYDQLVEEEIRALALHLASAGRSVVVFVAVHDGEQMSTYSHHRALPSTRNHMALAFEVEADARRKFADTGQR